MTKRARSIPLVLIAYLILASFPTWMILLAVAQFAILAVKIGVFVIQRQTRKRIGTR